MYDGRRSADRRRTRRTGLAALALLLGTAAAALVLAYACHLGVAAQAVTLLGGLPGLYLGWVSYRDSQGIRAGGPGLTLAGVADGLASSVGEQWAAEAAVRRLNDPYPLPVSWRPATALQAGDWDLLVKLVTSGAGWQRARASREDWAAGPAGLAGTGGELAAVLGRVPTRRLVVLGEPGAGKTVLMVRLVLDLLARRRPGGPVPVLVALASWDPGDEDFRRWLAGQIVADHPDLAAPAPAAAGAGSRVQALLAAGLILPILDGLDEIPAPARPTAVTQINDGLRADEPAALTCRTGDYRPEAGLRSAPAVELRPLHAADVARYLRDGARDVAGAVRWDPVLASLGTGSPAGLALSTPLMAGLAQAIYNPRPGEGTDQLRDPAELCSPDLDNRAAVEDHLLGAFIPAAYRSSARGRWTARQAEPWLAFLARFLEDASGEPDFAWWQLWRAVPRRLLSLACGVLAGCTVGLIAGVAAGLAAGPGLAVLAFLAAGWFSSCLGAAISHLHPDRPSRGIQVRSVRLRATELRRLAVVGLVFGFVLMLIGLLPGGLGFGLADVVLGLTVGFGGVIVVAVIAVAGAAVRGVPADPTAVAGPLAALKRDRRASVRLFLATLFGCALITGLAGQLLSRVETWLVCGSMAGVVAGLALSAATTAWPAYTLARTLLALRHRLPWRLMAFLHDAHQRGALRQAGAAYQFRHLELQRRLAGRI